MIKKKNWCNVDLRNPGNPSQGEVMAVMLQVPLCPSLRGGRLDFTPCDKGLCDSFLLPELTKHLNSMKCSALVNFP